MGAGVRRLLEPFQNHGLFAGLLYVVDRALERSRSGLRLFYYELMVQPVLDKPLVPRRMSAATEVREVHAGDPLLDGIPPPPAVVANRFDQGAICLGAFQHGECIAYQWFRLGPYLEDEVKCEYVPQPPGKAAFDFDIYVFPDHRLSLGFAKMWDGTNRFLAANGIQYTFSRVSRFNLASRRAHDHIGARRVGRAVFLSARRFQLTVATIQPFVHLSFGDSPGPRFVLLADQLQG